MDDSNILISEIKAHCQDHQVVRSLLEEHNADFKGEDHQVDTYFKVPEGRLKLREGKIENSLIYYNRKEAKGLKESNVKLVRLQAKQTASLKALLDAIYGELVVVDKKREIYFINNVKFHLDTVIGLGKFIEIEAINFNDETIDVLDKQCSHYCKLFNINSEEYIDKSYSDLLI